MRDCCCTRVLRDSARGENTEERPQQLSSLLEIRRIWERKKLLIAVYFLSSFSTVKNKTPLYDDFCQVFWLWESLKTKITFFVYSTLEITVENNKWGITSVNINVNNKATQILEEREIHEEKEKTFPRETGHLKVCFARALKDASLKQHWYRVIIAGKTFGLFDFTSALGLSINWTVDTFNRFEWVLAGACRDSPQTNHSMKTNRVMLFCVLIVIHTRVLWLFVSVDFLVVTK